MRDHTGYPVTRQPEPSPSRRRQHMGIQQSGTVVTPAPGGHGSIRASAAELTSERASERRQKRRPVGENA